MTQNQYFYGEEFARKILGSKDKPLSLIVLGAGVDATILAERMAKKLAEIFPEK